MSLVHSPSAHTHHAEDGPWADISTIPERPGYYNVRSVTTYRWQPYKIPQNGRKGRWQAANEWGGWNNAQLPFGGDWTPNPPAPPLGTSESE